MIEERPLTGSIETAVKLDRRDRHFIEAITWGMEPSKIESQYGISKLVQDWLKWNLAKRFAEDNLRIGLHKAVVYAFKKGLISIPPKIVPERPKERFDDSDVERIEQTVNWIKEGFPADKTPEDQLLRIIGRKLNGKNSSYVAFGWVVRYMRQFDLL